MLRLRWTASALQDLARLHDFLRAVDPGAAHAVLQRLKATPRLLAGQPRLGAPLPEFAPREVRRLIIGAYELRYEVRQDQLLMLRLWHSREDR